MVNAGKSEGWLQAEVAVLLCLIQKEASSSVCIPRLRWQGPNHQPLLLTSHRESKIYRNHFYLPKIPVSKEILDLLLQRQRKHPCKFISYEKCSCPTNPYKPGPLAHAARAGSSSHWSLAQSPVMVKPLNSTLI